jgi:hypothetical protein
MIMETTDHQSVQYENDKTKAENESDEEINKLSRRFQNKFEKSRINAPPRRFSRTTQCYRCGSREHLANNCEVAKDKTCHNCGKLGHLANVCKSEPQGLTSSKPTIRYIVAEDTSSDDDFILAMTLGKTNQTQKNVPYPVTIGGKSTNVLIDSGSTINVISRETLKSLHLSPRMEPFRNKVFAFGTNIPLPINQCFTTIASTAKLQSNAQFVINQ